MLKLRDITKVYGDGESSLVALKDISVEFRSNEFVSVLGHSGCGKTTLLNIIGGLDKYTSGDLFVNNLSTKHFKDKDWDAYRNEVIGFVFQSYNLISHQTVLKNVEMALRLSGVSAKERKVKALAALAEVGLTDKINKKPNQLSGGQMQRVAIARAIVNQPKIILADEPTGALDSETSKQVINILKKLSETRLVIMVTHNHELAKKYSDRIIKLVDGEIVGDSKSVDITGDEKKVKSTKKKAVQVQERAKFKKTSMSFLSALMLSLNNLLTKKTRSLITAFAGSIGIIGVALVLAIANGFNIYLANFQRGSLMSLPIEIPAYYNAFNIDAMDSGEGTDFSELYITHTNYFSEGYIDYLENMNSSLFGSDESKHADIIYRYNFNSFAGVKSDCYDADSPYKEVISSPDKGLDFKTIPDSLDYFEKHLSLLAGRFPENANEVMFALKDKVVSKFALSKLGFDPTDESITPQDIIDQQIEYKWLHWDDFMIVENILEGEQNSYGNNIGYDHLNVENPSYQAAANNERAITFKVVGVVVGNEDDKLNMLGKSDMVLRTSASEQLIYDMVMSSQISREYRENGFVYIWGNKNPEDDWSADKILRNKYAFGGTEMPFKIMIYSSSFETKEKITEYLNKYNDDKSEENKILIIDEAKVVTFMFSEMINIVSIVLIAFSGISLVVSSIMIGIITYVSVIERTKEIGVLRSLGARKKDIARVFLAESMIIGFISGFMGIIISFILTFPVNAIVRDLVDVLDTVAVMNIPIVLALVGLSTLLTLVAGLIPARIASKKDPVVALRTE